jgi:hypothetical protein
MEKPSGEFFKTLGQYVYSYIDPMTGKKYYTGKGNNDRCWAHVVEKGFDPEECYIIARNLERFEDKKDWQSFLLESFIITNEDPDTNKVSGHYKECFEMASLSSFFGSYQAEQYDNFESLPEWYIENYDTIRGNVGDVRINASSFFFKSNAKNGLYMFWTYQSQSNEPIRVTLEISNRLTANAYAEAYDAVINFLESEGKTVKDGTSEDKKAKLIRTDCDTIDEVIDLFKKFVS